MLIKFTDTTPWEAAQMDMHEEAMAKATQPTKSVKWLGSDEVTQIIRDANERKTQTNIVPFPAKGL